MPGRASPKPCSRWDTRGCKEGSVCYPPQQKQIKVNLGQAVAASLQPLSQGRLSVQDRITARLKQGSFILNVLAFFTFGALLSLTPCVFPMIPILSGIIVGQPGTVTARRGFLLSLSYVLAMALTYSLLGVLAGSFQVNLQAASRMPGSSARSAWCSSSWPCPCSAFMNCACRPPCRPGCRHCLSPGTAAACIPARSWARCPR